MSKIVCFQHWVIPALFLKGESGRHISHSTLPDETTPQRDSHKIERAEMKESHYFLWATVGIHMDIDKHVAFDVSGCPSENYHFNDVGSWNYRCLLFTPALSKLYISNSIFLIYFYCDTDSSVDILTKPW